MIFITLGTQDKTFERLLIEIDLLIRNKIIQDEVIVQAGHTKYESESMKVFDFINMEQFEKYISECDILITHGGVGSILSGINHEKKVIAVARRAKYKEHENDHQLQIISEFVDRDLILGCRDVHELKEKILMLDAFKVRMHESNNSKFCQLINDLINE